MAPNLPNIGGYEAVWAQFPVRRRVLCENVWVGWDVRKSCFCLARSRVRLAITLVAVRAHSVRAAQWLIGECCAQFDVPLRADVCRCPLDGAYETLPLFFITNAITVPPMWQIAF